MKTIRGKVVLLTGGSRGLGPYIANALAKEGADIALTARTEETLDCVIGDLGQLGVKASCYSADITDPESRLKLVESVRRDFGQIDILVNNAGIEWISAYADLEPGAIEQMITTNLIAPMLLTRLILPEMLARESGYIVTISSLGGFKGSPYSATYAATKAGLIEWSAGLRAELYQTGVSATVVCPGFVSEEGMFAIHHRTAPGIVGESTPEDVAKAVVHTIQKDRNKVVVNPKPIWPLRLLDILHPDLGPWILRKAGVYEFYRQLAEGNKGFIEAGGNVFERR